MASLRQLWKRFVGLHDDTTDTLDSIKAATSVINMVTKVATNKVVKNHVENHIPGIAFTQDVDDQFWAFYNRREFTPGDRDVIVDLLCDLSEPQEHDFKVKFVRRLEKYGLEAMILWFRELIAKNTRQERRDHLDATNSIRDNTEYYWNLGQMFRDFPKVVRKHYDGLQGWYTERAETVTKAVENSSGYREWERRERYRRYHSRRNPHEVLAERLGKIIAGFVVGMALIGGFSWLISSLVF